VSTADPPDGTKSRKPWIWLSALLTVVAAGLLIWALTLRSDLDSAEQELDRTQQELAGTSEELGSTKQELETTNQDLEALQSEGDDGNRTGAALVAAGALYHEFAEQLGATQEELAATQQDLEEAERTAEQADQDAEAAKQEAADAGDETAKAQAQADQAKAEARAAESRASIAADCAKAYIAAFGALFEGESASDQAPEVREQLSGITATCKDELAGS
jgi:chromosome segregation ATPase